MDIVIGAGVVLCITESVFGEQVRRAEGSCYIGVEGEVSEG